MEKVCVVGMGYVGIPVALLVADAGFSCTGIEISEQRVDSLNKGEYPIEGEEPGVPELLKKVAEKKSFRATTDYSSCKDADVIIVCVQTPFLKNRHEPNYSYLKSAIESISKNLKQNSMLIVESTLAPGTMTKVVLPLFGGKMKPGKDLYLIHCPERVTPGKLLYNLKKMDRIVGGINKESTDKAIHFYSKFIEGNLHPTDMTTAETVKTAENSYRDVEIAFANELALICERLGVDFYKVRELVNTAPYRHVHLPGVGVGGHCIPKDPWLLMYGAGEPRPTLLETSRNINDSMPKHVFDLISKSLKKMSGSKITLLGISYMEESDDMRNSPGLVLYDLLKRAGALISVCDPFVSELEGIETTNDWRKAVKDADCVVLVTTHSAFKEIAENLGELKKLVKTPVIVDGRRLFNKKDCERNGFVFSGVGRT